MKSKLSSDKQERSKRKKKHAVGRNPNSLKNLKPAPWKKGQSGNPKGRPKRKTITETIHEVLEEMYPGQGEKTNREMIARVAIKEAIKGGFPFVKEVMDRTDGRVPFVKELKEDHQHTHTHKLDIGSLSDDEQRKVKQLFRKARLGD